MIAPVKFVSILLLALPGWHGLLFASGAVGTGGTLDGPGVSYLLLDARTGQPIRQQWDDPGTAIPLGSLAKPFLALAWADRHGLPFPEGVCEGTATNCWYERGHGALVFKTALAHSCNSYFLTLDAGVHAVDIGAVARRFGLPTPPAGEPGGWIGLRGAWRAPPLALTRAYAELVRRREEPAVRIILTGLGLAAREGTASRVREEFPKAGLLAKTGTAPCLHEPRADGDGLALLLYPAISSRVVLLVQVHGVPGRAAASVAGRVLHRWEPVP